MDFSLNPLKKIIISISTSKIIGLMARKTLNLQHTTRKTEDSTSKISIEDYLKHIKTTPLDFIFLPYSVNYHLKLLFELCALHDFVN